jgi:hypothetical protein
MDAVVLEIFLATDETRILYKHSKSSGCFVEKIKEWVMRSFDDASLRRLFNWGRAAALPYHMISLQGGW